MNRVHFDSASARNAVHAEMRHHRERRTRHVALRRFVLHSCIAHKTARMSTARSAQCRIVPKRTITTNAAHAIAPCAASYCTVASLIKPRARHHRKRAMRIPP
ncbi:MAG: hypothetical protein ACI4L8_12500, partial [Candidatus Fimadaptatus sp.]